jgi:RNA polymerase sigma-70 factor, ECF subfamily
MEHAMVDTTRTTRLLDDLHDPANVRAWMEFDRHYRPTLHGFARAMGVSANDAADVAQETMLQFFREYRAGRYDRNRGGLRSWLISIARTRIALLYRTKARQPKQTSESAFADQCDDSDPSASSDAQWRRHMLAQAIGKLRQQSRLQERTIHAFELLVLRRVPTRAVAQELGMSEHDVYLAKGRIARRLKSMIASYQGGRTES